MFQKEKLEEKRARALEIIECFKRVYPEAECSLDFETPFELMVATILSAQCTDARVNLVTPALFKRFPDAKAMARAKVGEVEKLIASTGFYKNKAKALVESAKVLVERHRGQVPRTLDELVALRGVGRKTANVILGVAYGIPGMVVDTHVGRLSRRLGFTEQTDPVKVEREMMQIIPRKEWTPFGHLMISHGRARCAARKPDCRRCEVDGLCPKIGVAQS